MPRVGAIPEQSPTVVSTFPPPIPLRATLALVMLLLPACTDATADSPLPEPEQNAPVLAVAEPAKSEAGGALEDRAVGTFAAKETVRIAASAGGTLATVNVRIGDAVKKGDTLFRISGTSTKLNLSSAKKALEIAEQQAETAERERDRLKRLFDKGAGTSASVDQAQSQYEAAQLQVEQARLNVSMSRSGVVDLVSRAPSDGIVTARLKEPGETVTMAPATVVLELQDRRTLEARFDVPEADLAEYPIGRQLEAYIPALRTKRTIEVVRSGIAVDPATRTIEIICEIDNPDLSIKPGMSFEASQTSEPSEPSEPSQPSDPSQPSQEADVG